MNKNLVKRFLLTRKQITTMSTIKRRTNSWYVGSYPLNRMLHDSSSGSGIKHPKLPETYYERFAMTDAEYEEANLRPSRLLYQDAVL